MEADTALSLQTKLIRKMQAADGQTVCFATAASKDCNDKECCWRHDCFDESLDQMLSQEKS